MRLLIALLILFPWFAHAQSPRLSVVTESSPPLHYVDKYGRVAGESTDKVRQILKLAALEADFSVYPWARSYTLAEKNADTLIFSLAKTAERKDKFYWIAKVSEFHLSVVGLRDEARANKLVTMDSISRFTFAVQRDDVAHHWLVEQGFTEGDNLMVCADIQCSWNFLVRGTVDFIIEDPSLIAPMAKRLNINGEEIVPVTDIPELALTGYLAASKSTDKAVVQRLKDAAQQLGINATSGDAHVVQR
ncbi:substrate-binding periplasmic protein [Alteromonas confluentis]|uniref:Solute-binding protein family 3/N-terminal domain-containing protein n=1 Tax=Alteromonas confluentis TaxID=1656094 RepID=A0A1E7ZC66_9ALTE|nr:transporter substrate-binding domain-containing protein [Alteromonas confluentis]OFC71098.1 hypothetical protein BFC18_09905 [Alteromonas confluentis]